MLLIKVVVLMVKNQTILSSFQNNEKEDHFPYNFQLSTFRLRRDLNLRRPALSLSVPRLGPLLYQDILQERAKFDNRNNFYLCFLHFFAKELQLKIYFCIQLQNNCVLTKILHKIFKMFVILYN